MKCSMFLPFIYFQTDLRRTFHNSFVSGVCPKIGKISTTSNILSEFDRNNPELFLNMCHPRNHLILGSLWDPFLPDPAFDRQFPSYWMDRLQMSPLPKSGRYLLFWIMHPTA